MADTNTPLQRKLRLGRKRPIWGPKLRLKNYLYKSLPSPPATVDYSANAQNSLKNVYLNDSLGDCVIAGGYHVTGTATGNAGDEFVATSAQIIADYSAIGGYVPGNPATDQGCDEQTALNYWTTHGFANGTKLAGWLAVDATNQQELMTALWLFEHLYYGIELPDAWTGANMPQTPGGTLSAPAAVWDVAGAPDPQQGHCIMSMAYDSQGMLTDTWGSLVRMTYGAAAKYAVNSAGGECYVMLTPDMINKASQKAPNGFDWSQLVADFDALGGSVPVPPDPNPTPVPPVPVPPGPVPPNPPVAGNVVALSGTLPAGTQAQIVDSSGTTYGSIVTGTDQAAGSYQISSVAPPTAIGTITLTSPLTAGSYSAGGMAITVSAPMAAGTYMIAPASSKVVGVEIEAKLRNITGGTGMAKVLACLQQLDSGIIKLAMTTVDPTDIYAVAYSGVTAAFQARYGVLPIGPIISAVIAMLQALLGNIGGICPPTPTPASVIQTMCKTRNWRAEVRAYEEADGWMRRGSMPDGLTPNQAVQVMLDVGGASTPAQIDQFRAAVTV